VPFYRFEFRDETGTQTMPEIDLPDLDAAYDEAKRSARDLLMEATLKGEERTGWACCVYDQDGQRILSVDFEDIVLNRADDDIGTGLP
jgi:hypothetical protein